ncbi:MAG TPA: ArgE/DapE family deacylase [Jatrophihabitans sp.]|jgi:acetylornithine deacetylase|uniref:ArgE/DapE family deacylase n=1 Tax=Jatrophihabitans sp. TaxID=1932789 RepID=UPI002EECD253
MLSDTERRALDALDEPALHRGLLELLAAPSITGSAAETELLHALAGQAERLDLEVDLWQPELAELRADPDFPGTEAERDEIWGLVASTEQRDGPTVILQGHVDVVPPGDPAAWAGDPFTPQVDGDLVHARGACDMKAGVAANLAALAAIRASGVSLAGRLALHLVASEEDGGLGAFATLRRGHRGDACLIPEPTALDLITANCGALTFELSVPGVAAHGSIRTAGVSAIEKFLPLFAGLRALEAERNTERDPLLAGYEIPAPLSIGQVSAGDWPSTVPDLLVAHGRYGVLLDEDPLAARAAFEQRVAEVCDADPWLRAHPASVRWSGGQFASWRLAAGDPLRSVVAGAHADTVGGQVAERGAPYGSDLRLYAGAGIPTLHYGPGEPAVAHSAHERVSLTETVQVARTLIVAVLRLTGTV